MAINIRRFFRVCNPSKTLNMGNEEDQKYYIDFSSVRGSNIIRELKRTITFSEEEPTCQLFTGHIGCGKSTELSRLKSELEAASFHVVYFESSQDLDMADVDISDILLAIARQVSKSLEAVDITLEPTRFQRLLQGAANLLNTRITDLKIKIPTVGEAGFNTDKGTYSLAFGIGEITAKAKDSKDIRSLVRQHLEPRVNNILEAINEELIAPATAQLKQRGKAGLVVIIDNLDRIHNSLKLGQRTQPEYLFVDRGEQLNKLQCHVVYTIPLMLAFSNDKENLTNRFGSDPKLLTMVRVKERNGNICKPGIELLRKMVLARAFPEAQAEIRHNSMEQLVDAPETLDRICQVSGGHVRNLLVLLFTCLQKDDPPFSRDLIERVISQRRSELIKPISADEWELLKYIAEYKTVRGEDEYESMLRSLFVFEYRDQNEGWFDVNPVLEGAQELEE